MASEATTRSSGAVVSICGLSGLSASGEDVSHHLFVSGVWGHHHVESEDGGILVAGANVGVGLVNIASELVLITELLGGEPGGGEEVPGVLS